MHPLKDSSCKFLTLLENSLKHLQSSLLDNVVDFPKVLDESMKRFNWKFDYLGIECFSQIIDMAYVDKSDVLEHSLYRLFQIEWSMPASEYLNLQVFNLHLRPRDLDNKRLPSYLESL
jgi:hypothetical protein